MQYLFVVFAYLFGSLSFAIITSKALKMDDPRNYGSKNAGATNVMRSGNKKAAALTLFGDFIKGLVAVCLVKFILGTGITEHRVIALCAIFVVIGHIFPIFFGFRGGKGVATALGVFLGLNFILVILTLITWFITFKLSKVSSLAALVALALSPVFAFLLFSIHDPYFIAVLVISYIVLYKHKANILRLASGEEHSFKKSDETDSGEIKN